MTLYPALSKYGIGDSIDGKTVIYVRHGKKDKIQTGFFLEGTYKGYNVIGENWRYIAVDVDAAKASEKRMWASSAKNIVTSDGIGAGKGNTEKIIAAYPGDTAANNAAKYCKDISTVNTDGYLPSEAEAFLIFHAIRNNKITGFPPFSQIENGSFDFKLSYFWTSTQSNITEAYVLNLFKDTLIGNKVEIVKTNEKAFVCPVIYYDDNGKVVK